MSGEPPVFLQPQFVMIIFMVGFMYFLVIRPQQKKQKEHAAMLAKLDKNNEVVTTGGIHGTIVSVAESTLMMRVADNVKIEVDKSSIAYVKK